jgi:hypothetical protein
MSNELKNPRVLHCPADTTKTAAKDFGADFGVRHISYFIGLDSRASFPASFLSGDNHLTNGQELVDGQMRLTSNQPAGWGARHRGSGWVVFPTGGTDELFGSKLKSAIASTGLATNILLMNR